MESVGLGGPKWHGSSWQRGIAESGSSRLSTLMIDVPGDLVWDLPCLQQASYLEGGPLMWMLPLYLHVNQKSDYIIIYPWQGCSILSKRKSRYWDFFHFAHLSHAMLREICIYKIMVQHTSDSYQVWSGSISSLGSSVGYVSNQWWGHRFDPHQVQ